MERGFRKVPYQLEPWCAPLLQDVWSDFFFSVLQLVSSANISINVHRSHLVHLVLHKRYNDLICRSMAILQPLFCRIDLILSYPYLVLTNVLRSSFSPPLAKNSANQKNKEKLKEFKKVNCIPFELLQYVILLETSSVLCVVSML